MAEEAGPHSVQQEVARLRAELEAVHGRLADAYRLASLGRLMTGIVHEMNTPLASILSNSAVIERGLETLEKLLAEAGGPAEAQGRRAAEILEQLRGLAAVNQTACERISALIPGVKAFARVEEAEPRKADVNAILRSTLPLANSEFRSRVTFETDLEKLPEIYCYVPSLYQVFLNLLVNAAQAIEQQGRTIVRTRREGAWIHVSVSDTGRGIPPEDRPKIFTSGFTTKPVGVGTGLGLSICRQIVVDRHGGKIDFESEPGAGTTFHVWLPLEPPGGAGG
jgi:signal transduction histidine kinase